MRLRQAKKIMGWCKGEGNCMGSGTTAIAAIREKRNFIGFEKSEEYWRKSMERIRNELSQQTLF